VNDERGVTPPTTPPGGEPALDEAAARARARAAALVAPLDPEQREAVLSIDAPTLVVGGAGSGKTRLLAHRIAWLVAGREVPPRRILAISPSVRGAEELRFRAQRLLGEKLRGAWIGPLPDLCQRLLRAHASAIGRRSSFAVLSPTEARTLVRRAAQEVNAPVEGPALARLVETISSVKNLVASADAVGDVYHAYEALLVRENALDSDDVILSVLRLLDESESFRERYRRRFQHVLVDRFEDLPRPQLEVVRILGAGGSVLLCGDDDQSLLPRAPDFAAFAATLGDTRRIALRHAYRGTRRIVYVADRVIRNNPARLPKEQGFERRRGQRVIVAGFGDENEEAAYVVRWVQRLHDDGEASLGRTAIMFRHDVQARPLEEALARAGLPYRVASGLRFYERREIRDAMCYLRLAISGGEPAALARIANVPRRGIGPASVRTIARLQKKYRITMAEAALRAAQLPRVTAQRAGALADLGRLLSELDEVARRGSTAELIDFVVERTGYGAMLADLATEEEETRREGLDELRGLARSFPGPAAEGLPRLFERAAQAGVIPWAVASDEDDAQGRVAARARSEGHEVQLLSYPAAKGREFDAVFMIGLEEGVLPRSRALDPTSGSPEAIEAERRLCYVGMTRARNRLFMTWAQTRTLHGKTRSARPSRFLTEAGRRVRWFRLGSARPGHLREDQPAPVTPEESVLGVVREGQSVVHPRYGAGVVVAVHEGAQPMVTVRFETDGEKRLALHLARLRPG
jgi:DNA helicase-2/ATP-dependent DNA helicase PcrA